MQGSELPLLSNWHDFYMMIGTAAATLTGLMFVATSLAAGAERRASTLDAGISAFNTPTVVHFGSVLLISGILSAPWQAFSGVRFLLGLLGLAVVIYLIIVRRRMRQIPHYQTPLKDWLWYIAFPLLVYIVLIIAAIALPANPALTLYVISAAMLVLLFLGIHNAWDLVTFFALARSEAENTTRGSGRNVSSKRKNAEPKEHGK
jgi:hypothetical protein